MVIRSTVRLLCKYVMRNKAAVNHTIYLQELLLTMINISAASQMCSKKQRHTSQLGAEVPHLLDARYGTAPFQIYN